MLEVDINQINFYKNFLMIKEMVLEKNIYKSNIYLNKKDYQ